MGNGSQHSSEPSLAALLGGIMNDAKDLLIHELTLAKLEVQDELRQSKTAALSLGIGIGVAAVGGMLLSLMFVHVLAAYTDIPLWGCYGIVGSVLAVLGEVLLASGTHKAEAIDVVPQTVETMKENVQWLREQMTSGTISRTPVRQ
jgi:putative superfamily III holin-X